MKKILRASSVLVSIIASSPSNAAHPSCEDYMLDITVANSHIPRFGGAQFGSSQSSNPISLLANRMLERIPIDPTKDVQIAVPVSLEVNDAQPQQFGDGVQNAGLSFGHHRTPPFAAVLERGIAKGRLHIKLTEDFPGISGVSSIEVSIRGVSRIVPLKQGTYLASFEVDLVDLRWFQLDGYDSLFFRPVGWNDRFAVLVPGAYYPINKVLDGAPPHLLRIPTGESIVDPLNLRGSVAPENALLAQKNLRPLGFEYGEAIPRVHGEFLRPTGGKDFTAVGTARSLYRLPHAPGFSKLIYLAQLPRDLTSEAREGLVSGTGPHRIGSPAAAEIIFNSLSDEPLMTFHGISAPQSGPQGEGLAWRSDFTHLYVGRWLRPHWAFVAIQGTFHQHLTHRPDKAAFAQVLTPPEVPNINNHFGFGRY